MPARRCETDLLLACARTDRSSETASRIGALVQEGIDWERLLRMAQMHKLMPLLYWQLSGIPPENLPADILKRLRDHFNANHLRNLFLTGELLKLSDELGSRGIPALPYKGPVLASLAHGNLAFREFGDLDILVPKCDVLKARDVLVSLGYVPQRGVPETQEAALLRYDREYIFLRDNGSVVELHWTVAPRAISFMLDPACFWRRTMRVSLGGSTVSTLSREDTVLTLCVHGASHLWGCVAWICDVAELVRVSEDLDWEELFAQASATNTRRMLLLGLSLARDLLDAELPEEVSREASADAAVERLTRKVREHLFNESLTLSLSSDGLARWRYHLQMMERSQDKLRYLARRVTTPTLADWEHVSLPTTSLYRLFRLIRLSGELGRSFARRLQ